MQPFFATVRLNEANTPPDDQAIMDYVGRGRRVVRQTLTISTSVIADAPLIQNPDVPLGDDKQFVIVACRGGGNFNLRIGTYTNLPCRGFFVGAVNTDAAPKIANAVAGQTQTFDVMVASLGVWL